MRNELTFNLRATRDPELHFSNEGRAWCSISAAWNEMTRNDQGEWETRHTEYYDVVVFGDLAEHVAEAVTKGMPIIVKASKGVEVVTFERKDGTMGAQGKILADDIQLSLRDLSVQVIPIEKTSQAKAVSVG